MPNSKPLEQRRAGLLLHPTSLPGPLKQGDLGREAYRFVDFLAESGASVWQTLPLGPTHAEGSPYSALSVHAGNPRLIDLGWLEDQGWVSLEPPSLEDRTVADGAYRQRHLNTAHLGFKGCADAELSRAFDRFCAEEADWLEDFALFYALKEEHLLAWPDWPAALRDRHPEALEAARAKLSGVLERVRFEQFVFFRQWRALRDYAHAQGIYFFGDMPIFVAYDSAEVWAYREYFDLDEDARMHTVTGVPPDLFSATGQRWGNPHYHWERMKWEGFHWWIRRMESLLNTFDLIRIDHFRGFCGSWVIDADANTAENGYWMDVPGDALLRKLNEHFAHLPLVAENLGEITEEVKALRQRFELPGMAVLQFAFEGDAANPHRPYNHSRQTVVYTGTHDNNTSLGWYQARPPEQQRMVDDYLGHSAEAMPWPLIRAALNSVAELAVIPMQDVLALDAEHRMNVPGTVDGNWLWRFQWAQLPGSLAQRLRRCLTLYGRIPEAPATCAE